jgi:hypothetical protein
LQVPSHLGRILGEDLGRIWIEIMDGWATGQVNICGERRVRGWLPHARHLASPMATFARSQAAILGSDRAVSAVTLVA